jgi:23S rRNA (adenine2503-C2)-methyltransferase
MLSSSSTIKMRALTGGGSLCAVAAARRRDRPDCTISRTPGLRRVTRLPTLESAGGKPVIALKSLTPAELDAAVTALGLERYRADQIADWVYRKRVTDFAAMTNLPPALRGRLAGEFDLTPLREIAHQVSSQDGTRKFLLGLRDGEAAETVLMPMDGHYTVCVSSQVGCRFACKFCVTARRGLVRNLGADEIVQQVLHARAHCSGGLNIVYMGMGEPLDNFAAVVQSIRVLTAGRFAPIGARRITVSTTGVPDRIRALADLDLRVKLALSLNASTDAERKALMPVSGRFPLADTLAAAADFARRTGHHVTLEYVLLRDVNDRAVDAERLRALGGPDAPFKLNLIPWNPDPRLRFRRPDAERVAAFARAVDGAFRSTSVRWSKGVDIDAACGQLFGKQDDRARSQAG